MQSLNLFKNQLKDVLEASKEVLCIEMLSGHPKSRCLPRHDRLKFV